MIGKWVQRVWNDRHINDQGRIGDCQNIKQPAPVAAAKGDKKLNQNTRDEPAQNFQ